MESGAAHAGAVNNKAVAMRRREQREIVLVNGYSLLNGHTNTSSVQAVSES
jgi:hypothetical protein